STDSKFTGSLKIEDREILIVDMEKVITEILPKGQDMFSVRREQGPIAEERATVQVFLAEDSAVIRDKVKEELSRANYVNVRCFPNGFECYQAITQIHQQATTEGKSPAEYLGCVISDIEMPQMDGLAMCRNIKENLMMKDVPVIMFSSLINEQIARKCRDVGADAYITKPQFTMLVDLLDEHALHKDPADR
ncbi:chemotaxis protein CheV, partial [bacterium DOLJORAL78_65_58]